MFTVLFILGITLCIVSFVGIIFVSAWNFINVGFNLSPTEETLKRRSPAIAIALVVLLVGSFYMTVMSAKNLSESSCDARGGDFKSWDSGFAWECFQVEDPGAGQTIRVVD